jgi:hypothetical protein
MIKIWDIVALVLAVAVIGVFSVAAYGSGSEAAYAEIRSDEGTALYPLDRDTTVAIEGPLGTTYIEIAGGHAGIVDSPCRDKLCIRAGMLGRDGRWAACLPNRVFLRIVGGQEDEVDALAF